MTDQGKKYLFDILHSIELIEEFLSSISNYNEYTADLKTQSAVERQLVSLARPLTNSISYFLIPPLKMLEK